MVQPAANDDNIVYLHADHLDTPRKATDQSRTVVWQWHSEAFGSTAANDDPDQDGTATTVNLRFPGQYFDQETNLHYNYFRDYNPNTGRYVQSDPIGLDGGWNSYSFVLSNPIQRIDPYGLDVVTLHIGISIPFLGGIEAGVVIIDDTPDLGGFLTINEEIGGLGRFRSTIGVSQSFGDRCDFDGVGASIGVGFGEIGGSVGIPLGSASGTPTSITGEIGPQLGYSVERSQTFSITARDVGRGIAALIHGTGGGTIVGENEIDYECTD